MYSLQIDNSGHACKYGHYRHNMTTGEQTAVPEAEEIEGLRVCYNSCVPRHCKATPSSKHELAYSLEESGMYYSGFNLRQ